VIIPLVSIVILLFFSFLYSSSETAYFSLHPYKLVYYRTRGRIFKRLLQSPRRLLITILLANTTVNVIISALSERILKERLSFFLITLLTTYILLLFGEYIPKVFAINKKERIINLFTPPMYLTYAIAYPFSFLFSFFLRFIDRGKKREEHVLEDMLEIGLKEGALQEVEFKFSEAFITLSKERAKNIMRPRTEIFFAQENKTCEEVLKSAPIGIKRIPVYKDNIDNITGILELKCIFGEKGRIRKFVKPAVFVNEEMDVVELLLFFKRTKHKAVMVVDEYGGISGIVDIEDVERMFLRSLGEKDPDIKMVGEDEWIVDGRVPIYKINELLHSDIEASEFTTISGLILYHIGRVPSEGERFSFKDMIITVEDVKGQRIEKLRIKKRKT